MPTFTAYKLVHRPGKGNFMVMEGGKLAFRYDEANLFFWDNDLKREVKIRRAEFDGLLGNPQYTANAGHHLRIPRESVL